MSYVYDSDFFDYIDGGVRRSATAMIGDALSPLAPGSVLDVGCGRGLWLSVWQAAGVSDVTGVDGDYVERSRLAIPEAQFVAADLTEPVDLGRRFDVVQSLEVAEHLPPEASDRFVETLVRHGDIIVFSAAVPGQGGENHINEQPIETWRARFASHGYDAFDAVRPRLRSKAEVEPWYRFNTLIYANPDGAARLPSAVRAARLAPGTPVPTVGNLGWRLRLALVALLPRGAVTAIARVRAAAIAMQSRWQSKR
ncbi:MAG: methyltransferase domain-containing protein [Pseudomonadota bacterium]